MKNEPKQRVCKGKDCNKILPIDYKYEYCEACRNARAQSTKSVLRGAGAAMATALGVAVFLISGGKINLRK